MHNALRHLPGNMWNLWKTRTWIDREATGADFKLLQPYKKKRRTNKIAIGFQEAENHTEGDMNIQIIDRLLSIPGNQQESTIKRKRVERFWQAHLRTVGENGLNTIVELLRNLLGKKFKVTKNFQPLLTRNNQNYA